MGGGGLYLERLKISYQRGNQKPLFENQATAKSKMTERHHKVDKIHYYRATGTPLKHGDELNCSGRVRKFCTICGTRRFSIDSTVFVLSILCLSCTLLCWSNVLLCQFCILLCASAVHGVRFENSVFVLRTLCLSNVVLCSSNALLCSSNVLLCSSNVLMCSSNVLLCSSNVLLCSSNVLFV